MYVDPGTLMPVASALAAVGGILMMFWRRIAAVFRSVFAALARLFRPRSAP